MSETVADAGAAVAQPREHVRELSDELMAALAALDPGERALVVLRHVLGYRASELARMLDIPAATVRTRLARALGRLRAMVELEEREAS